MKIPSELAYIRMLEMISDKVRQASEPELQKYSTDIGIIGTSLSALYQASTCHRKCRGGPDDPHILEALAGRAHNLGCSSYILLSRAFYDEGLLLVRSITEISNLIYLNTFDEDSLQRWISADHKSRLKNFSPVKVRCLLEKKGIPYLDEDWYSSLCEKYAHVSPSTRPNLHNEEGLPYVGGVVQPDGVDHSLAKLATVLGLVALVICKYFEYDDLHKKLRIAAASNGENAYAPGLA